LLGIRIIIPFIISFELNCPGMERDWCKGYFFLINDAIFDVKVLDLVVKILLVRYFLIMFVMDGTLLIIRRI
jgi:hypothetical protein